jgi:hypothetical protein
MVRPQRVDHEEQHVGTGARFGPTAGREKTCAEEQGEAALPE